MESTQTHSPGGVVIFGCHSEKRPWRYNSACWMWKNSSWDWGQIDRHRVRRVVRGRVWGPLFRCTDARKWKGQEGWPMSRRRILRRFAEIPFSVGSCVGAHPPCQEYSRSSRRSSRLSGEVIEVEYAMMMVDWGIIMLQVVCSFHRRGQTRKKKKSEIESRGCRRLAAALAVPRITLASIALGYDL